MDTHLVLASNSLWRRHLLEQAGFKVTVAPVDVHESLISLPNPELTALARARAKAALACVRHSSRWIVAGDTVVEGPCHHIMDKARSIGQARGMLKELSGSRHQVFSAVVLRYNDKWYEHVASAWVTLKQINEQALEDYLLTKECLGKAGGLCVQGEGEQFVEKIEGETAVVIGLPLSWVVSFFHT